jgi:hypothetical protein
MMSDPQVAEMIPPETLAQAVQALSMYSNPLYVVFYLLELLAQAAFLFAIITRNKFYFVLLLAMLGIGLLGFAVSLILIPPDLFMTLIQVLIILIVYGGLLLYFFKSKRVEIYFKGTWEKLYLGTVTNGHLS